MPINCKVSDGTSTFVDVVLVVVFEVADVARGAFEALLVVALLAFAVEVGATTFGVDIPLEGNPSGDFCDTGIGFDCRKSTETRDEII